MESGIAMLHAKNAMQNAFFILELEPTAVNLRSSDLRSTYLSDM